MLWWFWWGPGGWPGLLASALFWVLVIVGVFWLYRTREQVGGAAPRPTPEQVLAERYAAGDIDDTEFHERLKAIRAMRGR